MHWSLVTIHIKLHTGLSIPLPKGAESSSVTPSLFVLHRDEREGNVAEGQVVEKRGALNWHEEY
jgi:hypothetical protein